MWWILCALLFVVLCSYAFNVCLILFVPLAVLMCFCIWYCMHVFFHVYVCFYLLCLYEFNLLLVVLLTVFILVISLYVYSWTSQRRRASTLGGPWDPWGSFVSMFCAFYVTSAIFRNFVFLTFDTIATT